MDTTPLSQSPSWVGHVPCAFIMFCSKSSQIINNSVKLLPVGVYVILGRLLKLWVPVFSSVNA